jgi:regulatory protein
MRKQDLSVEGAKTVCLRLLTFRARSQSELRQRLTKKGFAAGVVSEALADLTQAGLVNDREFARAWVENRIQARPAGLKSLRWDLRRFGLDDKLVTEVLAQYMDEGGEVQLAREAALARLRRLTPPAGGDTPCRELTPDNYARLNRFLASRGFSYAVIRQVIKDICGPETTDEF